MTKWRLGILGAVLIALTAGGMAFTPFRAFIGLRTCWPEAIVLHHTALPSEMGGQLVSAAVIDRIHERQGLGITCSGRRYRIAYHYLILQDGTIESGRPENCYGAHSGDAYINAHSLGIALNGNFSSNQSDAGPTDAQLVALQRLVDSLLRKYNLSPNAVLGHADVRKHTVCPGDLFSVTEFRRELIIRGSSF